MNYVIFADQAPAAFLPATCNWFCAHAAPKYQPASRLLVEPHEPNQLLGIVHLAGEEFQNRIFKVESLDNRTVQTRLRYENIQALV